MRYYYILLYLGVICLAACGGDDPADLGGIRESAGLTVLQAPAADAATLTQSGEALSISFKPLDGPCLLQLALPAGVGLADWRWEGDTSSLLTLVLPGEEGVEIAVTPLGELSDPVSLDLTLGTSTRTALGTANAPVQTNNFEVVSGGSNNVRLQWEQYIPGDYNFDVSARTGFYRRMWSSGTWGWW